MERILRLPAVPFDLLVHSWYAANAGELIAELELDFEHQLDAAVLASACDLLVRAEPVLGCRLVVDAPQPYWRDMWDATRNVLTVTETSDTYYRMRHSGMDPTQGVQMALCLWRREKGDRLLIKITHQVGDGGGLNDLAASLSTIYTGLKRDPGYRPVPKAEVNRDIMQLLPPLPWRAAVWEFVQFMAPRWLPLRTHALPFPIEPSGRWGFVVRRVPANYVSCLSAYGKQRNATLNDMFLAATYRALASQGGWNGSSGLRVTITVDLRRYLPTGRAEGISNLSSIDCPFLGRNLGRTFDETLANVCSLMQERKKKWLGLAGVWFIYFVMKHKGYEGWLRASRRKNARKRTKPQAPLVLSNAGSIDKARLNFAGQAPLAAHILPPIRKMPCLLVCLSGYDGMLTLSAGTPSNGHPILESFFDALLAELPRAGLAAIQIERVD